MQPLLSVWFRPGDTIDRVLAGRPGHSMWLLPTTMGVVALLAILLGAGWTIALTSWWLPIGAVLAGTVGGIITLYVLAWCLRAGGRMLSGEATSAQMRAVVAWGYFVPAIVETLILIGIFVWLSLGGPIFSAVIADVIQPVFFLWSLFIIWRMIARVQQFTAWRAAANLMIAALLSIAISIILAISIRTLLFQPFNIPAGSTKPTLLVGDYIFVSKYAYGYSRYSLPFSPPLFSGRIWATEPQRGDMVVFRLPKDPAVDYVKRVVGLPGDRIQMIGGVLHINGTPVQRERVEDFIDDEDRAAAPVRQWRETLPNGVSYDTLDLVDDGFADNTALYTVPPGHYFMMGDNRDNSTDSRFSQVGMVPFENLIGRVAMIFNSLKPPNNAIRWERIGSMVR